MTKIDVEKGTRLYYEDWGAGKPMVFIHGWPFTNRIFDYQKMSLAQKGYRVVAIDLRGFGFSDKPWNGYDYDTWCKDIGKVIKDLNLNDVTLAGYGMGGAIAAHYAATQKDPRIAKLVLLGAALPWAASMPDYKKVFDGYLANTHADQPKAICDYAKTFFNTPISDEYGEWLGSMGRAASLRACMRGLEELRDRDLKAELGEIRVPTLICHGAYDKIMPFAMAEETHKLIKNSTLVRFENSGHGLFWDEKDRLVDELAKFVAEKLAKAA